MRDAGTFSPRVLVPWLLIVLGDRPSYAAEGADPRTVVLHDGLGEANAIAQTPDGYIWFGSLTGLYRFDGSRHVAVDMGRYPHYVRRLFAARDGSLWLAVGTGALDEPARPGAPFPVGLRGSQGGVLRYHDRQLGAVVPPGVDPFGWVWAFAESRDGAIWMGTEQGLLRIADGRRERISLSDDPARNFVSSLMFDDQGVLWMGTAGGLASFRDGKAEWGPIASPVIAIAARGPDDLWVLTFDGPNRVRGGKVVRALTMRESRAILPDGGDGLWVGGSPGLVRIDADDRSVAFRPDVIRPGVRALMRDREGSIWAAIKAGGIAQLRPTIVRNLGPEEGLPGTVAIAVLPARDGSMWFSTENAVGHLSSGQWTSFPYDSDVPYGPFRPLSEAPDGSLWSGAGSTVSHFTNGRRKRFDARNGIAGEVRALVVTPDGALHIAWMHGGVTSYPGADFSPAGKLFDERNGLCAGAYRLLVPALKGGLWLTGSTGLSRLENGVGRCLDRRTGLPSDDVTSVVEEPDGTLWLTFAADPGLARVRDGTVVPIPPGAGLPSGGLHRTAIDQEQFMWLTSYQGVFRINKREIDAVADGRAVRMAVEAFTLADGMRSENCNGSTQPVTAFGAHSGEMWVSTGKAFSMIAANARRPRASARALIEEISLDGASADPGQALTVPAGTGTVAFRFAAPSFLDPRALSFEHRIDGVDRTWVKAGDLRDARYSHPPPGRYTFRVRVVGDTLAAPDPGVELSVEVLPGFQQTWWFRGLCVLAIAVVVLLLYRSRIARLHLRFAAVHEERARIARELHDGLAQLFLGVGFHLDALRLALKGAPDKTLGLLETTRQIVDRAQAETRSAIWTLRADPGMGSLKDGVGAAVELARRQLGIEITLEVVGPVPVMPGEIAHEVPRIVQEALTNSVRHGKADRAAVRIEHADGNLSVTIVDNGSGLPPPGEGDAKKIQERSGYGIVGMKERAAHCGGTLTVSDVTGGGTEVRLTIPHGGRRP